MVGVTIDWLELARCQSARFWKKVDASGDCWLWLAGTDKDGYGKFAITAPAGVFPKQKHVRAHRLSWELRNGPLSDLRVTRHSCNNPPCVNPDHIQPGVQADNIGDQLAIGTHITQLRKTDIYPLIPITHCWAGHEFTSENTYTSRGMRHCLACNRRRMSDYRRRLKAKAAWAEAYQRCLVEIL